MPNGGYVKENGIALCPQCHIHAENDLQRACPADHKYKATALYKLIGSSYEEAVEASNKLK